VRTDARTADRGNPGPAKPSAVVALNRFQAEHMQGTWPAGLFQLFGGALAQNFPTAEILRCRAFRCACGCQLIRGGIKFPNHVV
jgi:hypothetical protein